MWDRDTLKLGTPDREYLMEVWEKAKGFIEDAIPNGTGINIVDVQGQVLAGIYQLWVVTHENMITGAFVTELHNTGVIDIVYLGGNDFHDWGFTLMPEFENICAKQGLRQLRICGRKGWVKLFKGYNHQTTILAKTLQEVT